MIISYFFFDYKKNEKKEKIFLGTKKGLEIKRKQAVKNKQIS
jgi:hypothetical protein